MPTDVDPSPQPSQPSPAPRRRRTFRLAALTTLLLTALALTALGIHIYRAPFRVAEENLTKLPPWSPDREPWTHLDDARYNRTEGFIACHRQDWDECSRRLNLAMSDNEAYESDPEIIAALKDAQTFFAVRSAEQSRDYSGGWR